MRGCLVLLAMGSWPSVASQEEERKGGIIYKWMNGQLNLEVNEGEAGINERKRWRDGNVLMVDG